MLNRSAKGYVFRGQAHTFYCRYRRHRKRPVRWRNLRTYERIHYLHKPSNPSDLPRKPLLDHKPANGTDSNGDAVTGFDWWYFPFPALAETGVNAFPDFSNTISNYASFGGTVSYFDQDPWGVSYCSWGDGNASTIATWFAKDAIIEPTPLPNAVVSSPVVTTGNGGSFGMTVTGGLIAQTVNLSTVPGSASLIYQVDNTNQIVTVTQTSLSAAQQALVNNTHVKVFGTPVAGGAIAAYVLFYYTGIPPR
jgi:hypothetical protein